MQDPEKLIDYTNQEKFGLAIKLCLFEFEPGLFRGFVPGVDELSDIGPLPAEEILACIDCVGDYCRRRFPIYRFTWWSMAHREVQRLQRPDRPESMEQNPLIVFQA